MSRTLTRREFLQKAAFASGGLAGACLLSGCGPTPTPQTTEVEVTKQVEVTREVEVIKEVEVTRPPAETITLALWHHWGGTREPLLDKAFADFSAYNPGIAVEPTLIPWERKEESVLSAVAAGEAPDILMLNASEVPPYAIAEALVPLDELVAEAGIDASEVYESDWEAGVYNGKRWGLPHSIGEAAWLLFYNKQLFEEAGLDPDQPPETWAEMLTYAQTLLKKEGNSIEQLGIALNASGWSWLSFLAENEAAWLSDDSRQVLMDNEGAVEALQFIVDISDSQGGPEHVGAFMSGLGDVVPFAGGYAAMNMGGVWDYYILKTNTPDLDYGSAVAPINKGIYHEANYGPHQWTIPAGTEYLDAAWRLVLWMTREEGGCDFLTPQLRPSPWKACNENSPLRVADYWPVIQVALDSTRPEPSTPLFNQFLSIWDEMIEKATYHAVDAAEAVKWSAEEMTKANDEYWA